VKMFDAGKTRMIGLPYGEKNYDDILSRFHLIPERYGQTDGRTQRIDISISRVSADARQKVTNIIRRRCDVLVILAPTINAWTLYRYRAIPTNSDLGLSPVTDGISMLSLLFYS